MKEPIDAEFWPVDKNGKRGRRQEPIFNLHPDWPTWRPWQKAYFVTVWLGAIIVGRLFLFWIIGLVGLGRH